MARRTKEQLIAEIERIDAILRLQEEFRLEQPPRGPEEAGSMAFVLPSREEWMAMGAAHGFSQVLRGWEEALSDAVRWTLREDLKYGEADYARAFQAFYKARTGRELRDDLHDPGRIAKAALRRGRVKDHSEYVTLREILNDGDQAILSARQAEKAEALMRDWEEKNPDPA